MRMYKAVVSDLDGTLLGADHRISDYTREVLRALQDQGVTLILATGRHHLDVRSQRDRLGMDLFLITSNGARVHDPSDQVMIQHDLPESVVSELLAEDRGPAVHVNIYREDEWLTQVPRPEWLAYNRDSGFGYRVVRFDAAHHSRVTKVFFIGEHEQLTPHEAAIRELHGHAAHVTFSLPECLEVMAAGVSKGAALQEVLARLGLEPSQAVVFGDGLNDYEMLSMAGRPVLMGNAHEPLRQKLPQAERIGSHRDDSVARHLEKLFL